MHKSIFKIKNTSIKSKVETKPKRGCFHCDGLNKTAIMTRYKYSLYTIKPLTIALLNNHPPLINALFRKVVKLTHGALLEVLRIFNSYIYDFGNNLTIFHLLF